MNDRIFVFLLGALVGSGTMMKICEKEMQKERQSLVESARLVQYLADIIEKHDVPIDEFDAIAVRTLVEGIKHPS